MSDDKFDAIVVGAGVAGSVAALVMARAGLDVLVIERGDSAGCKNMTGGRLYAHTLEAIIPGFAVSSPACTPVTLFPSRTSASTRTPGINCAPACWG